MTEGTDAPQGGAESGRSVADEMSETFAKLGGGERFAVMGAAIALVGWVLFDLLIDEYALGHLPFALSVLIVGAAYTHHRRASAAEPVSYKSLLFVAAGILGLLGLWDLIEEIRAGIFDDGAATVIGALVYYAGAILAGLGALQLRSS